MGTEHESIETSNSRELVPGTESREVFSSVLGLAKDLLESGVIKLTLDREGRACFLPDLDALSAIPEARFVPPLTRRTLTLVLYTELASLVQTCAYGDPLVGLRREIPKKLLNELGVDEFGWRLEEVRKRLTPRGFAERLVLRRTSKGLFIDHLNWEVLVKQHDGAEGSLGGIPLANVSIEYSSPEPANQGIVVPTEESPEALVVLAGRREPLRVTFQMHELDIEELIDALTAARDCLRQLDHDRTGGDT